MNSKERVLTTFEHKEPDRVSSWCGASVEFWEKAKKELNLDDEGLSQRFGDDFRRVFGEYRGPKYELSKEATWRSPFGIERTGIGYGQPLSHPLADATSVTEIESYDWPDPKWIDVSTIKEQARPFSDDYAILGGDWSPFWHDAIDLLGHEYNLKVMMHCCGGFQPLFPSLIETGLDGIHALQPSCQGMEPGVLKHDFGGQIVLNCLIKLERMNKTFNHEEAELY